MLEEREVLVVKLNETYGRVIAPDWSLMEGLTKKFAIWVENARWDKRVKAGTWDGKIHFVRTDGVFQLGLLQDVLKYLKAQEDEYVISVDPKLKNPAKSKSEFKEEFVNITSETLNCPFDPRPHQVRGAVKAAYYKRAICEHCTSSGKSLSIAMLINYLLQQDRPHKILVLVPRKDLVEQLSENFIEYGIPGDMIGKYVGYQKDEEEEIIVATWQSMVNNPDLIKKFTAIICDECHGLKAKVVKSVAEAAINAEYRLGFTGTLPDALSEKMQVISTLGPVVDLVEHKDLVKIDQIAKIKISVPYLQYGKEEKKKLREETKALQQAALATGKPKETVAYNHERDFIYKHEKRNKFIANVAKKSIQGDKNTLILLNKHDHVETVVSALKEKGIDPHVVTGKTKDMEERNNVRKTLEDSGGNVLVATSGVYSTGISIKRLHTVVFADAGKSKITVLQSVGRGLRMHSTKSKLHLIDIADALTYGDKHLDQRLEYYARNEFEVDVKEVIL